jgi:PIN like domain
MDERYGPDLSQSVADTDWIIDASSRREILLSKDRAIAKRPLEAEAIYYSSARALVIASAQITGPEMLNRLVSNSASIERLAARSGPWVWGVYRDRLAEIRLNYI